MRNFIEKIDRNNYKYYFLVTFCIGVVVGIIIILVSGKSYLASNFWLILSLVIGIISIIKFRKFFLMIIFISGLLLGAYRMSVFNQDKMNLKSYFGQKIVLSGSIVDDINYGPDAELRFKLNNIQINDRNYKGEVWANSRENINLKRSDKILIKGELKNGFGGFSASLTNTDILEVEKASNNDTGLIIRDNFANATDRLDQPGRSLGLGFLLGQKNDLPEDLDKKVKNLGLSHMIVASGYNLTILVVFARRLFAKISKFMSVAMGGIMMGGFLMITGFSPSMSRAGLVAGMSLAAWYYGRKVHPVSLLLVSGSITLLIKPTYIWGDLGWYLSFLAFIGVLILAPLINNFFWGEQKPSIFRELVITTICAQIMTLPILIYSFGLFSAWSLLANILILPVVPIAMLAVFIAGLGGLIFSFAGGILALPANFLLKYCIFIIDKITNLPSAVSEISLSLSWMVASYLLIFGIILMLKHKTHYSFLNNKNIID